MIKVVIVDDEADARFLIRNLLERHCADKLQVVAEADDVKAAVETIQKYQPDVVFLDIRMNEGTGFDVLEQLPEKNFEVVFVTAYDQYAVKAFQFSALGYLMKPIKIKDLKAVIDSIVERNSNVKETSDKRLKVLIENYGDEHKIKKLVIAHLEGFEVADLHDIVWLQGDGNYTHLHLQNGKRITATKALGAYEDLLNDYGFFRVHQSTVINLRHVSAYHRADGGFIELSDGHQAKLSRHRKTEFMKRFL